ncbi:MAG: hypothetical protein COB35_11545 [Gammaproteobacteria bacterium]|nr:MAG: hypothetical protein COB35_11545 [Gammaproteobacteria bacterium]
MNPLLLSELSAQNVDLIKALLLLDEFIFDRQSVNCDQFDQLVSYCKQAIADEKNGLIKVQIFLETIFVDLLFVDEKPLKPWQLECYQFSSALAFRKISPALKLIIIQELARRSGLVCDVVFIPESLMVRIECDEDYAIIFEPITGEAIDWETLDHRVTDLEGDPESISLDGESATVLLRNYLLSLKNALIANNQFQAALRCVDVLLAMKPNDPLERRDRGFLLHQLDCFKVAYDDYRYFVEQCPEDPAAQLLKLQLDNIHITEMVLH